MSTTTHRWPDVVGGVLVEGVYVSPRRWEHLERAREIMEQRNE